MADDRFEAALAAVDAIAREGIEAGVVRFRTASSIDELRAAYRLRNDVAVHAGWIAADAFPDGLERDEYDDRATHIIGVHDDRVVAAARLIFPQADVRLPMEDFFDVDVEPRGAVVELGRQSIDADHRRGDHLVFYGLLAAAWLTIRERGFHFLGGLASQRMLERYREMGFDMTVVGGARHHWGEDRYPIRFDVVDHRDSIRASYEAQTKSIPTSS